MADIIPTKRLDRRRWLSSLSKNVMAEAARMGASPADAAAAGALADEIVAAYDATDDAERIVAGKRQTERLVERKNFKSLRRLFARWKTLDGYHGSGSERTLQLKSRASAVDVSSYKPKIKVTVKGAQIVIEYRKRGIQALAIYGRLRGETEWKLLGIDSISPFIDQRPLANPAASEVREYMARGMIKDAEVGIDSDIITITFGG